MVEIYLKSFKFFGYVGLEFGGVQTKKVDVLHESANVPQVKDSFGASINSQYRQDVKTDLTTVYNADK